MATIPHPPLMDARSRRVRAAQLAARLGPAAWALGGYATSAAVHVAPGLPALRPDVAVVVGEAPFDGVVHEAPLLVVELGGGDPQRWLQRGVPIVWVLGRDGVWEHREATVAQWVAAGGTVQVEGTGLRLVVDATG